MQQLNTRSRVAAFVWATCAGNARPQACIRDNNNTIFWPSTATNECPRGLMDKASPSGGGDCGFESCRGLPFCSPVPFNDVGVYFLPNTTLTVCMYVVYCYTGVDFGCFAFTDCPFDRCYSSFREFEGGGPSGRRYAWGAGSLYCAYRHHFEDSTDILGPQVLTVTMLVTIWHI